jgi:hypothetical protein
VVKLTDEAIFGTDLNNTFGVDASGDLKLVVGITNAEQRVYNRIMTKLDELEELGYDSYGNESQTVLGETDKKLIESKIQIYTESCLKQEPVVEDIISVECSFDGRIATVECEIQLIGETNTSNLVFGLEVS